MTKTTEPVNPDTGDTRKIETVFSEYLPNDGEFEYTTSTDGHGTVLAYLRRLPELHAKPGAWWTVDKQTYQASKSKWDEGWL
jgi:hypothetical protein